MVVFIVAKRKRNSGLTLMELVITAAMAVIVIFGVGVLMVDGVRGWKYMYNRVYSDVVTDGYVAQKTFDSIVRKASGKRYTIVTDGSWVIVYYYSSPSVASTDRYAKFYVSNGNLMLAEGPWDGKICGTPSSTRPVCTNVTGYNFSAAGRSVQMLLTLNNGSQQVVTMTSAFLHNE